jgi:hypothetical protein
MAWSYRHLLLDLVEDGLAVGLWLNVQPSLQVFQRQRRQPKPARGRDFIIDNQLVWIPFISAVILAERPRAMGFEFSFPGSNISTFIEPVRITTALRGEETPPLPSKCGTCKTVKAGFWP